MPNPVVILNSTTPGSRPPPGTLPGSPWVNFADGAFGYINDLGVPVELGGGGASVTVGDVPPDPAASGDLWFNSVNAQLYVRYEDADSAQWVVAVSVGVEGPPGATGPAGGTFPDAPSDGALWARRDGGWDEVTPDAPSDGVAYGRLDADWTPVLPLAGGTVTGGLSVNGQIISGNQITTTGALNIDGAINTERSLKGTTAGVMRFYVVMASAEAEGGGNSGANFHICSADDAGAYKASPMSITRVNDICTFSQAIVNGPSDRSLKENIEPITGALEKVMALQGVSFDWKSNSKRDIGLIAQDVISVVPEIVQDFPTFDAEGRTAEIKLALDYPKLTALLIEAVKELSARLEAVEGAR